MDVAQAAALIESRRRPGRLLLVGLDGIGGSGKSTLATELAARLGAQMLEMDLFYSDELQRQDWDAVRVVLDHLRAGKRAESPAGVLAPTGIVLVEGVFALHETLRDFYDVTLWVECPPAVALERGLRRSAARGLDETDIWTHVWLPQELAHRERVRHLADLELPAPGVG